MLFVVDKVALEQVFVIAVGFSLSFPFRHCSLHIHISRVLSNLSNCQPRSVTR